MPVDKPVPEMSQPGITKDTNELKINEATLKNNVTLQLYSFVHLFNNQVFVFKFLIYLSNKIA